MFLFRALAKPLGVTPKGARNQYFQIAPKSEPDGRLERINADLGLCIRLGDNMHMIEIHAITKVLGIVCLRAIVDGGSDEVKSE